MDVYPQPHKKEYYDETQSSYSQVFNNVLTAALTKSADTVDDKKVVDVT